VSTPDSGTTRHQRTRALRWVNQLEHRVINGLLDALFVGLGEASAAFAARALARAGVERVSDVAYMHDARPEHRLDLYRPRNVRGSLPVLVYWHGGGFRILSKETHWKFGLRFAEAGYLVVVPNYRLAPAHPFPAALEDAASAWEWVCAHAAEYGGTPGDVVLAGESAGANVSTTMAWLCCHERPEPWAKAVFDAGVVPRAVMPACGLLQVSAPERLDDAAMASFVTRARMRRVFDDTLRPSLEGASGIANDLADPLLLLEGRSATSRPLPPFFVTCGGADVLLDDSRRLIRALEARRTAGAMRSYPNQVHAFQALGIGAAAEQWWVDTLAFLRELGTAAARGSVER
jgi:acetyl esterase